MKDFLGKIWLPLLIVAIAAVQSFGIEAGRLARLRHSADSIQINRMEDSSFMIPADTMVSPDSSFIYDSTKTDSLSFADTSAVADTVDANDTSAVADTIIIEARDTIRIPDSLEFTDPFKFKYYIAIKDSTTRFIVRDSLLQAGDTLELQKLDSLYIKDSTEVAQAKFQAWYNSLTKKERKKYDYEQALPGKIAEQMRKLEVKDSIKAYKDSVRESIPRILQTFAIPDSLHYKRIVTWKHDRYFHNLIDVRDQSPDSSYNHNFHDYPFYNQDVNASWLGVAGSPVQLYDYFKRESEDNEIFYAPYRIYSFTPENLPQYNTKTPYTELCYWGNLLSSKVKEETNIKILTTQNILPGLNLTLGYHKFGGKGMLRREDTDNRNAVIATNYVGERYMMHAGFIYNKVERSENGGIIDNFWIRDTTVDSREIEVYLRDASNKLKKNTLFLDQSYRIPFTFLKDLKGLKERKMQEAVRDSIMATGDSLAIQRYEEEQALLLSAEVSDSSAVDTLDTRVTTAFIGHSTEYSVARKTYEDNITDQSERDFFNDRFYINPKTSKDSLRVMKLENRVFMRLQPWSDDAIVSKLDVGVGDKLANYYAFSPIDYLKGPQNIVQNSMYAYAGANGQYKKYLIWNAFGKYNFLGHEINDFSIEANASIMAYPFRRDRKSPMKLDLHFETSLTEPDYYQQHMFTNHYRWDNDFSKISSTKAEAKLSIPRWKMDASVGYALLNNNIYYDTLGIARQNTEPMSVLTASLRKDFQVWKLHFDHKATFQLSSNEDVLPLPMLALNLRYYLEFDVVKNVMQMQIGAHGLYTTNWYAPAYNPVVGVFHNQKKEKYGNCPYLDLFVNMQWKRVSVFIKVINVNMGWPKESKDYFTAAGYIAPERTIKVGITWPFYTLPGKKGTTGTSANSARGGSNAGLPQGMRR
ncbi:MAG: putative porin [Bacteroidales bacterium]|nr:putative porin [Bacteroidales bacterium]